MKSLGTLAAPGPTLCFMPCDARMQKCRSPMAPPEGHQHGHYFLFRTRFFPGPSLSSRAEPPLWGSPSKSGLSGLAPPSSPEVEHA